MTKIWTVEEIKELLRTSDKMVARSERYSRLFARFRSE